MVSPVVLLIALCVLAVHGQYDTEDYYYDYEMPTETLSIDYSTDWLYDLLELKDECDPNPCLNGGRCETTENGFECSCPQPYTGKKCSQVTNVCKNAKCGRGDCLVTKTAPFYECKCTAPYKPPTCKKPSACKPNPCLNGGSCVKGRTRSSFSCDCPNNYSGKLCHVDPNDCFEQDGENYRGTVSETEGGEECLNWNSYFVLDKGGDPFQDYQGFDGIGPHNYCRNPDGDYKPWCYVKRKGKLRWDHCNVRSCSGTSVHTTPLYGTDVQTTDSPTTAAEFSQCGRPQPSRTARIFGGMKSQPGAHPWQVSLQTRPSHDSSQSFSHICGGILIQSCWVLTAAHCINAGNAMRVVLGGVDIEKDEEFDQTIDVEKAIVHEKYREETYALYNDIALLKLKGANSGRCAKETRFVKTACLPSHIFAAGTECVISGWGATEKNKYGSPQLMNARVVLISQDRCKSPTVYGSVLDDSMFCAGNLKGGVDSCQGDSGGPLVCEQDGTHYVTGVVSWGDGCGLKNKPGVYADVRKFVDWIAAKIIAS